MFARCSPRRWQTRPMWSVALTNWMFCFGFAVLGMQPERLYRYYYGRALPGPADPDVLPEGELTTAKERARGKLRTS